MNEYSWLSAFLVGLAGSVHCVGMCGGIVSSFTFMLPKNSRQWPYLITYNMGRIFSYTIAGAFAGLLGASVTSADFLSVQLLPLLSGVFMVLLGLYIGNWWRVLTMLEGAGQPIWRFISPYSKIFLPFRTPLHALPYGIIWGWLPCGLVYSSLTWSMTSGSALGGALNMFFFGLGTLPALLALGASGATLRRWMTNSITRRVIALLLIIFGVSILIQALSNI